VETNYLAFLPLVILPAVAILFIWMFIRKDRMHAAEAGKQALYSTICGGIVGWWTYKGPFIRLAVYSEFLVVVCDRVYYLPFAEIQQIERRNFLFRKGYRIHHRNPSYPQRLEVWPRDRAAFEAAIAGRVSAI
jgi:hypothetical protein